MERVIVLAGMVAMLGMITGCDSLVDIILAETVTVRLVNATDYPIDTDIYISDDDSILAVLITELGEEIHRTIPPGMTVTFSRSCDELQAIIIDDAHLELFGGLGPSESSRLLLDGHNFSCGDTIIFRFAYDDLLLDLEISVDVG